MPGGVLSKIRGIQVGLDRPEVVDQVKADMLAGRFAYAETRAQISGERDSRGVFHIYVGHHRMAAAIEIYQETGNPSAVHALLEHGKWDAKDWPPSTSRPMPSRTWWRALRNRFKL